MGYPNDYILRKFHKIVTTYIDNWWQVEFHHISNLLHLM